MNPPTPPVVRARMSNAHTVRLTQTEDSIQISLDDPAMTIVVRVEKAQRRNHVRVYRPLANGVLYQAGELGWFGDEAKAMELALDAAQVLAIGLGVSALRGDASAPSTLIPPSTAPRTHELVEAAEAAVARIVKIFGKAKMGDFAA